jgi:hypothetical protein
MAITLKLKRTVTPSLVPTTSQLTNGELALNVFDGKLFFEKDNGTQSIVEVCNTTGSTFSGILNATSGSVGSILLGRGGGNLASNVAIGNILLPANTTGQQNIALGTSCLSSNTTGGSNLAIGADALLSNTNGSFNIAIGVGTLFNNITGGDNIAIGKAALNSSSASNNLSIGNSSLQNNTSGNLNVAIGNEALFFNTGSNNTAVGWRAGYSTSSGAGSNNTLMGVGANIGSVTDTNCLVLGFGAVGLGSNTNVIGNNSTLSTRIFGKITQVSTIITTPATTFTANTPTGILTCGLNATITVNNSLVTAGSIVIVNFRSVPSPATLYIRRVLPAVGSFAITFSATPTTTNPVISFVVIN